MTKKNIQQIITLLNKKINTRWDWEKGAIMIIYFLILSFFASFKNNIITYIMAWPNYLFPKQELIAAILEIMFAYVIATITQQLIKKTLRKKTKKPEKNSQTINNPEKQETQQTKK